MRFVKPIPRGFLIHRAVLANEALDSWGAPAVSRFAELTHVRIEPTSAIKMAANNQQFQLRAILFYDCHHSRPRGLKFAIGQRVEFGGAVYHVASIDYLDAFGPHHVEVGLV